MNVKPEDVNHLATLAYGAALVPERWQLVLNELSRLSGGVRTHVFGFDFDAGISVVGAYSGYDPAYLPDYDEYFHSKNVWAEGFINAEVGVPVHSEWMCPRDQLFKSEFYNDWIKPQEDIMGGGGALLFKENRRMFAFGGNVRRRDIERIEKPWLRLIEELVPHFRQAFEISRALAGLSLEKQTIKLARDPAEAACIVIKTNRRIVFANREANEMLEAGTVLRQDLRRNLTFADWVDGRRFDALAAAIDDSPTHKPKSMAIRLPGGASLTLRVAHLQPGRLEYSPFGVLLGVEERCFLVAISGNPPVESCETELRTVFGLTEHEAIVARLIADGNTTREISDVRSVSIHTIRNQLKSAMAKMHARRQADLVRIIGQMR